MCGGHLRSSLSVKRGFVRYVGRSSGRQVLVKAHEKLCCCSQRCSRFRRVTLGGRGRGSVAMGSVVRSSRNGVLVTARNRKLFRLSGGLHILGRFMTSGAPRDVPSGFV